MGLKAFAAHKTLGFSISISEVVQWWERQQAIEDIAQWHYLIGAYRSIKNNNQARSVVMDRC